MRVLVCIPCLLTGGTEIQTLSLVEALVAAGHEPVVACYFEHADTMVARFRDTGADVRLLSPTGSRPLGVAATTAMLWRGLRDIVRDTRPHAAHVQYMAPGALPILILRALGVRRIIATAHTAADIYSPRGLKIIRLLSRHVLSAFQCITERAERSFFGSSALLSPEAPAKLPGHFTIYNNIPSHIALRATPRAKDPAKPVTVGVVSRLEHIKGMDLVVPAFAEALRARPRLRLLVVGDGSQRSLMERQAAEAGIAGAVAFTGRKSQEQLSDCYDRIDILLMPSRSEGFGLTAVEGMARGCVPVVADTGGLPEVVHDGVSGLLHRPGDASDIAEKILILTDTPSQLSAMSDAALSRAAAFTPDAYARQIRALYESL